MIMTKFTNFFTYTLKIWQSIKKREREHGEPGWRGLSKQLKNKSISDLDQSYGT